MQKFIEPDELLLNYGACPSECEVDYESIETEWKMVDRARAKPGH